MNMEGGREAEPAKVGCRLAVAGAAAVGVLFRFWPIGLWASGKARNFPARLVGFFPQDLRQI
jgi:hypothetical protein